jgi:EAL and modified HD-GYP domain-containing signal transduction protein
MASTEHPLLPLVHLHPVANMQNAWVALTLRADVPAENTAASLHAVFDDAGLLAAIAPLHCIVMIGNAEAFTEALLEKMPAARVGFAIDVAALADKAVAERMVALQESGYRILVNGMPSVGNSGSILLRSVATDFSAFPPRGDVLPLMYGPHLAYGVHTAAQRADSARSGYECHRPTPTMAARAGG